MTSDNMVSDEQLNALLDNELDDAESARLMEVIRQDKALKSRFCDMRQIKDSVILAYKNPPLPRSTVTAGTAPWYQHKAMVAVAALALFILGGVMGWAFNATIRSDDGASFYTVDRLNATNVRSNRMLLHLATSDDDRVKATLHKVEELLQKSDADNKPIEIEVVANSDGLNVLRRGSPYATYIKSIASRYDNVSFMACGVAKQNAKLREGSEVALIPEAVTIPAALEQILKRVKSGWSYVRG
ncbi:MAG: hypothetical protein PVG89_10195 [Gammaproteobacteria bacterium]|jgi:intracellular sulfur oxidation DsrE/DsrF family protein